MISVSQKIQLITIYKTADLSFILVKKFENVKLILMKQCLINNGYYNKN